MQQYCADQASLAAARAQFTQASQDWERLSALWREDLDERINKLILLRDKLNGCIGCGCLSMEACPLRNQDDKLAEHGPGAQLLEPTTQP